MRFLSLALALSGLIGCGSTNEHPLGGPHGGKSNGVPAPTKGAPVSNDDAGNDPIDAEAKTPSGGNDGADATVQSGPAPTWTYLVNTYLKKDTIGGCGNDGCHAEMNTPSPGYVWLGQQGYSGPEIANPKRSPISWYGGNMPDGGPSVNAQATSDMNAWAAAGAQNN